MQTYFPTTVNKIFENFSTDFPLRSNKFVKYNKFLLLLSFLSYLTNLDKFKEYTIRCKRVLEAEDEDPTYEENDHKKSMGGWIISRRYRDFLLLNKELEPFGVDLQLPPKKLIGNTKASFLANRKV